MSPEQNHIDATVADLEGWVERIITVIETLKVIRSGGGALPGLPSGPSVPTGKIQHDTFFQMSVPDAAEKFLTLVKKTMPTTDISAGLLNGGLKSAAKNFPSMLNTIMTREGRFVRVNREWGLSTWYPGMRKATAGRKSQGTTISAPSAEPQQPAGPPHNQRNATSGSIRLRTLALLNSEPKATFSAPEMAKLLNSDNVGSVSAALSGLLAEGTIERPAKGRYKAK